MIRYFWRDGTPAVTAPLGTAEWKEQMRAAEAKHQNMAYKRVAQTTLPDGKWISTVWLGLDHGIDDTRPLIFETMVFDSESAMSETHDCERYCTEEQARAGHEEMVAKWSAKV